MVAGLLRRSKSIDFTKTPATLGKVIYYSGSVGYCVQR
jgi:hypothetical protein